MNLTDKIVSAEHRFKQILEEFFISVFDEKTLSSHGIDHHRRVWNYSKELLELLPESDPVSYAQLPSRLIIASYLHDIGMSVETGIKHGSHSKDFCIQFLRKHDLNPEEFQDVLEAIEYHDNKDYTGGSEVNDLVKILSVSDDLDAFGYTGIFRYSEIYLTRGVEKSEIGNLIRQNARKRFDNFVSTFGFADDFIRKHRIRFDIVDTFFEEYNKQVTSYSFGNIRPSGYCGVIELIDNMIIQGQSIDELSGELSIITYDTVISKYFTELTNEIL